MAKEALIEKKSNWDREVFILSGPALKDHMAKKVTAKSGKEVLKIAGKGLKEPGSLDTDDIQSVCASVVAQAEKISELEKALKVALKNQNKTVRGN